MIRIFSSSKASHLKCAVFPSFLLDIEITLPTRSTRYVNGYRKAIGTPFYNQITKLINKASLVTLKYRDLGDSR